MLRLAVVFLIIAMIAAVLGATNVQIIAQNGAWYLFVGFLILAVLSFVFGGFGRRTTAI